MTMAKLVFFGVLVAALVAVSAAQGEAAQGFRPFKIRGGVGMPCQRELQESSVEACRQVVERMLAAQRERISCPRSLRWSTGLRMRCCQQLQDISRDCRCAALRQVVRGYELQSTVVAPALEEPSPYYRGETAGQQQEQGWYGEQEQTARERMTQVRQYAAQLPAMCRLETQDCGVFSGGQY